MGQVRLGLNVGSGSALAVRNDGNVVSGSTGSTAFRWTRTRPARRTAYSSGSVSVQATTRP
jgi:hypothetical protein